MCSFIIPNNMIILILRYIYHLKKQMKLKKTPCLCEFSGWVFNTFGNFSRIAVLVGLLFLLFTEIIIARRWTSESVHDVKIPDQITLDV